MSLIFRAKVDSFFIKIISSLVLFLLFLFVTPLILDQGATKKDMIVSLLLLFVTVGLILWTSFSIYYIFYDDHLYVKGGPFRSRIPYESITKVMPSTDIITGYRIVSARNGLEIFYDKAMLGSIKISPKDEALFLEELKKRCPNLERT